MIDNESQASPRPRRQHGRAQSFVFAFRGIASMLRSEANARIHATAAALVLGLGLWLQIDRLEWLVVILTLAAVLCLEAVNTAFESLCDVASPEFHPQVERAKDVAAGAVLIAAIAAVAVAVLIFGRRLLALMAA